MARESALWDRLKTAAVALRAVGYRIDMERVENSVGSGHPDVNGCIDGANFWIELKSEMRPRRIDTPIHLKVRQSQSDWHKKRCAAGCTVNWVLLQVGESSHARLYLVPACYYDRLKSIAEVELKTLSRIPPEATVADVLIQVGKPWM